MYELEFFQAIYVTDKWENGRNSLTINYALSIKLKTQKDVKKIRRKVKIIKLFKRKITINLKLKLLT
jgi:hypothetical protein